MTKDEALQAQAEAIRRQHAGIEAFEIYDDDEVLLEGTFSSAELRAIVAALATLQHPDAWDAEQGTRHA